MEETTARIKKVINWLIFKGIAGNETELAELTGYKKSSFSQLVNGKVPLSDKFISKLCLYDENINEDWLKTGKGEMFKEQVNISQVVDTNLGVITNNIGAEGNRATNTTTNTTNNYSDCHSESSNGNLLGLALEEIAEQRKLVAKAQGQIDRLITLLEKK